MESEDVEERQQVVHSTVVVNALLVEIVLVNYGVLEQCSMVSTAHVVNYRLVFDLRHDEGSVDQEQVLVSAFLTLFDDS